MRNNDKTQSSNVQDIIINSTPRIVSYRTTGNVHSTNLVGRKDRGHKDRGSSTMQCNKTNKRLPNFAFPQKCIRKNPTPQSSPSN